MEDPIVTIENIPLRVAVAAVCVTLAAGVSAQIPESIHYQGRITVGAEPFDGTGHFKYAIVDDGRPGTTANAYAWSRRFPSKVTPIDSCAFK